MKLVICFYLVLLSTLVPAQFVSTPASHQGNGPLAAEKGHEMLLSQIPEGVPLAQRRPESWATPAGHSPRRLAQAQTGPEQVLYAFQGLFNATDGDWPSSSLIFDSKGNLYGTTLYGGSGAGCGEGGGWGCGIVFELSHNGSGGWTETILYAFQGGTDGGQPSSGLIFDKSGNLYGTTLLGGSHEWGTAFELSPNGSGGWTETVLYNFGGTSSDAEHPTGDLVFDKSGNLYGAAGGGQNVCTQSSNSTSCGTVFELSPNGSGGWTESVLYSFNGTDGWQPNGPLIFDQSGNLYGTTSYGGASGQCVTSTTWGCGTVFELSPSGSGGWKETTLYTFQGANDGGEPTAGVIFDQSGNLYGTNIAGEQTTSGDCAGGCGVAFELSPKAGGSWTETTLHAFQGGSDGKYPNAGVVMDESGNLYGTTSEDGGAGYCELGCGTVFELSPNGSGGWTETVLYSFRGTNYEAAPGDGDGPQGGVIFDQSGNLYGTTQLGGVGYSCNDRFDTGCGTVFEVTKEPFATLSPASLTFSNQAPGTSSSPQALTLTNSGRLPLSITSIQITGTNNTDFTQTNNCPSSLAATNSCKINVTFTPTAAGNRQAELQVADNSAGSPQQLSLSGTGEDFSLSVTSQTSQTVTPGQAANYAIAVSPVNGFAQKVSLSCSGAPAQSTCTITPSSVTLDGTNSAPASVAVVTSGSSARLVPDGLPPVRGSKWELWLAFSGLPGLVLLGSGVRKSHRRVLWRLLLLCVLSLVVTWAGCGGGGSSSGAGGTPPGTYTLTVTGTYSSGSANLLHSTKLTLVVQ